LLWRIRAVINRNDRRDCLARTNSRQPPCQHNKKCETPLTSESGSPGLYREEEGDIHGSTKLSLALNVVNQ